MKTKTFALIALTGLLAASAFADDGFSFVYRGRIDTSHGTPANTLEAVFSLYAEEQDDAPVWAVTNTVMPSASGVFQSIIAGEGLDEVLLGGARYLGIAIGGGEEQHPRQKILDAPLAERAKYATSLKYDGEVGTLAATNIVAQSVAFKALKVNGPLVVGNTTALQINGTSVSGTLALKKGDATVSVFRNAAPDSYSFDSLSTTNRMFHTDSGGVVTVLSDSGHWSDPAGYAPCVTWPVPPGDVYPLFDLPHSAKVYFYPFGASN